MQNTDPAKKPKDVIERVEPPVEVYRPKKAGTPWWKWAVVVVVCLLAIAAAELLK